MARTTGYEYKKTGIGERSGFQSRDSKSFGIDTTTPVLDKFENDIFFLSNIGGRTYRET
jgi:hypothetical protein